MVEWMGPQGPRRFASLVRRQSICVKSRASASELGLFSACEGDEREGGEGRGRRAGPRTSERRAIAWIQNFREMECG